MKTDRKLSVGIMYFQLDPLPVSKWRISAQQRCYFRCFNSSGSPEDVRKKLLFLQALLVIGNVLPVTAAAAAENRTERRNTRCSRGPYLYKLPFRVGAFAPGNRYFCNITGGSVWHKTSLAFNPPETGTAEGKSVDGDNRHLSASHCRALFHAGLLQQRPGNEFCREIRVSKVRK